MTLTTAVPSVLISAKILIGDRVSNAHFAKIGGVTHAELNRLEADFLIGTDFDVMVDGNLFGRYERALTVDRADHDRSVVRRRHMRIASFP